MYNQVPYVVVPVAATGVYASGAGQGFLFTAFALCGAFAVIGAVFAIRRTLPVMISVRRLRGRRTELELEKALARRKK